MKNFISRGRPPKNSTTALHAAIDGGIGKREIGSQRKSEQRDALAIDAGWLSTKLTASQSVFIQIGKLRKMVALSANCVPVRSK